MIITAHTGTNFKGVLAYVYRENKELPEDQKPIILEENLVWGNSSSQASLMNKVTEKNSNSSRPVLHITVSYPKKDELSQEEINKHLKEIVKEFGATEENNQYTITAHKDSAKDIANGTAHYHIVINKVGLNGQNINTNFIKNKGLVIADKLEKQFNLEKTIGRKIIYEPENDKGWRFTSKQERAEVAQAKKSLEKAPIIREKRKSVKKVTDKIELKIFQVLVSQKTLAKTPEELVSTLAEKGVEVRFSYDKENNNAIRGASFRSEKVAVGGAKIGYNWDYINAHLEHNKAQSLGIDHVSPPVQQSFKAEQKAKETTLNPISPVAQVKTAREEIAEKAKTNLDQEIAPGATPIETPLVQQPTANDFIAKKKWEDKYLYRGNNPDPKGTINNVAINETFKLALEMKSSMPKLANYSDEQIADQAIRLSMGNYKMGTFHNDKFITLSNPWDKWEKIRGKDHYEQLVKIVAEQKRGEIIILAENTKIESINQKIDIEEEKEQKLKGGMGLR